MATSEAVISICCDGAGGGIISNNYTLISYSILSIERDFDITLTKHICDTFFSDLRNNTITASHQSGILTAATSKKSVCPVSHQ